MPDSSVGGSIGLCRSGVSSTNELWATLINHIGLILIYIRK
jgi:hypothetical protein